MEFPCKDFKVGKCQGQILVDGEIMPLVLLPADADKADLGSPVSALKKNQHWFEQMIIKDSAVLLRGFDVQKAEDFNDVLEVFEWEDIRCVGPVPRTHVYKRVWTANEGPFSEFIYYHHGMVLTTESPNKLVLFCEVPPPVGEETPFVPSFKVTKRMLKELPEAIEEMGKKGLKYTFTALSKNDTSSTRGRGWEDAFGTDDREEAEKRFELCALKSTWDGHGVAAERRREAVLRPRPLTRVFDGRKGRRMRFNTVVGMHGKELSSAMMADGTELPHRIVKRCGEIIEEESIQFKWEKGDDLFFDNWALLHGSPPRRVLVATFK